jgi:hypothetical protein
MAKSDKLIIKRTKNKQWTWAYIRKNGKSIAVQGEQIKNLGNVFKMLEYLFPTLSPSLLGAKLQQRKSPKDIIEIKII